MNAYYNENDPFAAAWLTNLVKRGLIAQGEVDTRSIVDVRPDDVRGFTQCHFFAGIGVWSYALRLAGWPDARHVWTGSCPCGPFSQAGKGQGFADERHLWPAFYHLIGECRPRAVFGEQVASKDGLAWIDLVQTDMETEGYTIAALDLCAAGFGAPHIRQRLYWLAYAAGFGHDGRRPGEAGHVGISPRLEPERLRAAGILVDGIGARLEGHAGNGHGAAGWPFTRGSIAETGSSRLLADAANGQFQIEVGRPEGRDGHGPDRANAPTGPVNGLWRNADWLLCRDGKWRPVEPGTFPLAHGAPARVGRLRGYGNAIVAQVAAEFIAAALEFIP